MNASTPEKPAATKVETNKPAPAGEGRHVPGAPGTRNPATAEPTNQATAVSEPGPTRMSDINKAKAVSEQEAHDRILKRGDPQQVPFDLDPEVKKQLDGGGAYRPPKAKIVAENQRLQDEEQTFRVNAEHVLETGVHNTAPAQAEKKEVEAYREKFDAEEDAHRARAGGYTADELAEARARTGPATK